MLTLFTDRCFACEIIFSAVDIICTAISIVFYHKDSFHLLKILWLLLLAVQANLLYYQLELTQSLIHFQWWYSKHWRYLQRKVEFSWKEQQSFRSWFSPQGERIQGEIMEHSSSGGTYASDKHTARNTGWRYYNVTGIKKISPGYLIV